MESEIEAPFDDIEEIGESELESDLSGDLLAGGQTATYTCSCGCTLTLRTNA